MLCTKTSNNGNWLCTKTYIIHHITPFRQQQNPYTFFIYYFLNNNNNIYHCVHCLSMYHFPKSKITFELYFVTINTQFYFVITL